MKNASTSLRTEKFSGIVPHKRAVAYLLYLPEGYDTKSRKRWPLMLFLHGAGERGTDVQRAGIHGPIKMAKAGHKFPFIIVAPQCLKEELWANDSLMDLLDQVEGKYRVDKSRVYVTGLSMGGYGTWNLGMTHPKRFAAIVPICGGGEIIPILLATDRDFKKQAAMRTLGIWAFHGGRDTVIPPAESKRLVAMLRKAGCKHVKLTIYPDAGHDSWMATYNNPRLYEWLLKHRRK